MLKEQLLKLALRTITEFTERTNRAKNNRPTQIIEAYITRWSHKTSMMKKILLKKDRKTSIRPAKDIDSMRAKLILNALAHKPIRLALKDDEVDGKKSLACLIWALGQAEQSGIKEGMSVHDVSALLYHACKIELYPINVSRILHGNKKLVQQNGQFKRTKTYVLTADGKALFQQKFQ